MSQTLTLDTEGGVLEVDVSTLQLEVTGGSPTLSIDVTEPAATLSGPTTALDLTVNDLELQLSQPDEVTLELTAPGPQGAKGDKGDQGDPGVGAVASFTYHQMSADTDWTIVHNLGRTVVAVRLTDTDDRGYDEPDWDEIDENTIIVRLAIPFAGKAVVL